MMSMGLKQCRPSLYRTEICVSSLHRDPVTNCVNGLFPDKLVAVDKHTYKCVFHLLPTLSREVMFEVLYIVSASPTVVIDYDMDGLIYRINDVNLTG